MDTAALHLKITSDGMDTAQKGLDGLENAASMVESAFKKLVAAAALFKAGSWINEVTQLTARYETLGVVMRVVGNNAGYTGMQMEQFAQALQKQGISMVESRNTLSMMASAHIDLGKATQLGRVAQDAAVIGGINSSEAFQRMIYGIQSGQVEILRTIGLNVNFEQSYKKLGAQLGKNVADLTELEKMQARTNVVMDKGKDIAGAYEESLGTVGKAAKSMERIWENLQVLAGAVFQPAFVVIVDAMTSAMQIATEWTKNNADEMARLGRSIGDVTTAGVELSKLLGDIGGGSKGASEGVGFLTWIFRGIALVIAGTTDVLRAFIGTLAGAIGTAVEYVGKVADLATKIAGFSGKGGITNFGTGMQDYGRGILASLSDQTSFGRTLDGMAASHSSGSSVASEAARIAEAANRKAQAEKEAAEAAAAAMRAAGIHTNTLGLRGMIEDEKGIKPLHERNTAVDIEVATVAIQKQSVSVAEMDRLTKQLKRDSMDTWDYIAEVVERSSGHATDALVAWGNNLDGLGRSWRTLGDTVKSVIRDMLIQMQRAIVQQQMMDPLFLKAADWIRTGFGGGGGGGTPSFNTGSGNYGDFGYDANFSIAKPSGKGGTPQVNMVVNITGGKASVTTEQGGAAGLDLAREMEPLMNRWALKQSRAGGILARA